MPGLTGPQGPRQTSWPGSHGVKAMEFEDVLADPRGRWRGSGIAAAISRGPRDRSGLRPASMCWSKNRSPWSGADARRVVEAGARKPALSP